MAKTQVLTGWPWPYFPGHRGHLRRRDMKDDFRWISEEYLMYPRQIWYTEAPGQDKYQVQTGWPWPYFWGHRGHFKATACEKWFPLNIYRHQICYTDTPEQDGDEDWTFWPWPYFQGHEGHVSLFKMASAYYLKKYLMYAHQFGTWKHQGMAKTKFEPGDVELIFEVAEVI